MSVERILDEYYRWRGYDYTHAECMETLRERAPQVDLKQIGSEQDIEQAIRLLDQLGDVYPERALPTIRKDVVS